MQACLIVCFVALPLNCADAQEATKDLSQPTESTSPEQTSATDAPAVIDPMQDIQRSAVVEQKSSVAHWGVEPDKYSSWISHSNRLIPVYTFGMTLSSWRESGSVYGDGERLEKLYGGSPARSENPNAVYFDQTDVYRLQQHAIASGKKFIVLLVFDGMDWQTTRAASLFRTGQVPYRRGRGQGLMIQDYRGTTTDYAHIVTSPRQSGAKFDVNAQTIIGGDREVTGGYHAGHGGRDPWRENSRSDYLIGTSRELSHTVTDSAASATSLCCGIKTYNGAIGVDHRGQAVESIARQLQRTRGFSVGIISSVPVSHATPASAYANNLTRKDYQDISRDLIGLPSSYHREKPLTGVDVLMGGGFGEGKGSDALQGENFLPGNPYLHQSDLERVSVEAGGKYVVAQRTEGKAGVRVLQEATERAIEGGHRLLGFFGTEGGHLPFETADGEFNPIFDVKGHERYQPKEVVENPSLAEMTEAALSLLEKNEKGFWLMVEAGDVDWANHANNLDNSIGAVFSGDRAFKTVTEWAERKGVWDETAVIVTSDHGHFLVLDDAEAIAEAGRLTAKNSAQP